MQQLARMIGLGLFALAVSGNAQVVSAPDESRAIELKEDVLEDKIRGGMLGQMLGYVNGLVHEGRYIEEPGAVEHYIPGLPVGAFADDDTDIEWVYITAMHDSGKTYLSPQEVVQLWRANMNHNIWMSNLYARQLMDLGILPPLTGRIAVNPWASFNVSGHFVAETFGLIAPAMPRTASQIGLHYTHLSIDGEPAQSTQLFNSMIAMAFIETDIEKIVATGLAAVDPSSRTYRVVSDLVRLWKENPLDWKVTRVKAKDLYETLPGSDYYYSRDWAGIELNTAAMVGALLYGRGDFVETMRLAFNFGWDADCNAATVGTILGVMKGRAWMNTQGWTVEDRYSNRRYNAFSNKWEPEAYNVMSNKWEQGRVRGQMPDDETITSFENKVLAVAKRVIVEEGGSQVTRDGATVYSFHSQSPANVEAIPHPLNRMTDLRKEWLPYLEKWLEGSRQERARAAYLALCLHESERLKKERPGQWQQALSALKEYPNVISEISKATQWPVHRKARDYGLLESIQ